MNWLCSCAKETVNGTVFIKLQDGTVIESSNHSFTLRDLIELINAQVSHYNDDQLSSLKTMCEKYSDAMQDWNIGNILSVEK